MGLYGRGPGGLPKGLNSRQVKEGMREHGLTGYEGNKTVAYHAQQMAENRGKPDMEIDKDHYLWKLAERELVEQGNEGGDPHGKYRDHNQQSELDELRAMLDSNPEAQPEAQAEPEIEEKQKPITYSTAIQDAKERTSAFLDGSKESFNFYKGTASTENNQVEDPGSAMSVANNKTSTMNQGQSDPMLQSRHEDRNLNFH